MINKMQLKKCTYHRSGHFESEDYSKGDKHYKGFVNPNKLNELYDEKYERIPVGYFSIDQKYYDKYCKNKN
jgi:hypothetical protein